MNKIEMPMLFMFLDFMFFAFLYETSNLTEPLSYFLIAVGVGIFIWSISMRRMITFEEARELCLVTTYEMQRKLQLPHGTVRLMPETELKSVLLKDSDSELIEPDHWEVGLIIEGDKKYGFIYSTSIFGETSSFSEIDVPSTYSVRRSPKVKVFEAKKKASHKELEEQAQKKVQKVYNDEDQ